ncbi:uncharacterized protein GGS22DRAFT_186282 [Annulohypoxylon maeteangense]|uniref:uncharacterized protein n=1 Tax=Annulohypoxylon maeteangense TaxID=1927788 RepID=UPI002007C235|nr:uncharacterized protein GGS22DRAFT_186282 [Annulohypoxylon maeteangense]KAI0887451.1 hypothetical protein GGS22DRAFT_186282 [Annulohypoxylon maeteangense]
MSTQESSYAPKSPDLSSFYSGSSSDIPQSANTPGGYPFQAVPGVGVAGGSGASLRYNHNQPQPHQYNTYQSPAPQQQTQPTSAPAYSNNTTFNTYSPQGGGQQEQGLQQQGGGQYYSPQQQTQFIQTTRPYSYQTPTATAPTSASYYPPYSESSSSAAYHQSQAQPSQLSASPQPDLHEQQLNLSDPQSAMPPRKIAPAAKQTEMDPSPVRTKFPTARIKRIMQADEEVGKVAQQTPIAVGKALELFMVQLVRKSAEVAKEKNSKRITAPMLKQAVASATQWDFLLDIVAKVGEEKEGGKSSRTKPESDSEEEPPEGPEVKKKGRGGRKKKAPA